MSDGPDRQDLRLADGRRLSIDAVHIMESTAGIVYAASAEAAWNSVACEPTTWMPGLSGELPVFVVPPVSVRRDARVLPRWKVYVRLLSESLEPPSGPLGGGSHLVLAFFCDDIASSPITELISWRLASLDEATWRRHAWDWEP